MIRRTSSALCLTVTMFCGTLAAQESPPAAEDVFEALDANNDGVLQRDEISTEQERAFERLLRVGDADQNGQLTREEYRDGLRPDEPVELDQQRRGQQRFDLRRVFDRVDQDGDGKVVLGDFPEPMQDRLRPLFERLGKEELTREDLQQLRPGQGPPGQPGQQIARLFERADRDGNGKLAIDELPEPMQDRLQPLFERLGKEELEREELEQFFRSQAGRSGPGMDRGGRRPPIALLEALDSDEDGQLSQDEFEKITQKFAELDRNGDGLLGPGELFGNREGMRGGDARRPGQDNNRDRRPRRPQND